MTIEAQLATVISKLEEIRALLEGQKPCSSCTSLPLAEHDPTLWSTSPGADKAPTVDQGIDYDAMSINTLKTMCENSGKTWPKGTRATTMAAWLKDYDRKTARDFEDAAAAAEAEALDEEIKDPFAVEEDAPEDKPPARDEVTAKLREVLSKNGQADVVDILKNEAGVSKVKDIKDGKLAAVYKAACRSLEG